MKMIVAVKRPNRKRNLLFIFRTKRDAMAYIRMLPESYQWAIARPPKEKASKSS